MTIRHLSKKDPDRWYIIGVNYGERTHKAPWRERKYELHGPNLFASVSWLLGKKQGFGWGFRLGHNGSESDVGLDLTFGPLGCLWLRLKAPWTRWMQAKAKRDGTYRETKDPDWYKARHYSLHIWPRRWVWIEAEIRAFESEWSSKEPWYRHMSLNPTAVWGRVRSETETIAAGVCKVPMPEGSYDATWERTVTTTKHVRWPGTWWDWLYKRRTEYVKIDVAGGIPCEGKGENSWDCGMDGVFGTSGRTVEDAIGHMVRAVLRNRLNYGGPHDLDRPMTVQEAEARVR